MDVQISRQCSLRHTKAVIPPPSDLWSNFEAGGGECWGKVGGMGEEGKGMAYQRIGDHTEGRQPVVFHGKAPKCVADRIDSCLLLFACVSIITSFPGWYIVCGFSSPLN
jgi:hypothetical protein